MKLSFVRCLFAAALLVPGFSQAAPPPAQTSVASLIAVLNSSASQKEKADACRELARIGTKEAVAPLAALLGDEQLSHMARYGLETIPDPSVDKAFREALGTLSGRCLVGVIGSVGVRRDAHAVKPLAALLRHSDPDVVQAAARVLGQIGGAAAAAALEEALPGVSAANRLAFCEGLFRCAENFSGRGQFKRAIAIYDPLRAASTPPQARAAAWRGAILARQKEGLPVLTQAIRSEEFLVFDAGIRASLETRDPKVTPALAGILPDLKPDKQIVLIEALAKRGDPAALPALLAAARNCPASVRVVAIYALPELVAGIQGLGAGDQKFEPTATQEAGRKNQRAACLPVLMDLLTDSDRDIAQAARESLAALPGEDIDRAILDMMNTGDMNRRVLALDLIARRRMTSAIPELFKAAQASDPRLRLAAIKRLGELGSPADVPALLGVLDRANGPEDLDAAEQSLTAVSLKAGNADASAEKLGAHLAQAAPAQKCALLRALAAVGGPKALQLVRDGVKDSNADVHAAAIRALGGWNGTEAAPDLLELARTATDPTDKMLCLRSYLHLAAQSDLPAEQRLSMCRNAAGLVEKEQEKKLLLGTLGQIDNADSIGMIEPYLDDNALKDEAATAVLNVSEKLLQRRNAAGQPAKLIAPLEKVTQTAGNPDLAQRARALLEKAKAKGAK